jgi:hypothetical protein
LLKSLKSLSQRIIWASEKKRKNFLGGENFLGGYYGEGGERGFGPFGPKDPISKGQRPISKGLEPYYKGKLLYMPAEINRILVYLY